MVKNETARLKRKNLSTHLKITTCQVQTLSAHLKMKTLKWSKP